MKVAEEIGPSRRRGAARLLIGGAVSALMVWLAARGVAWSAFVDNLQGVNISWLLVGVVCALAAYGAMAFRWRALLWATSPLPLPAVFDFTMIGYLAGLVLPARLGDIVKVVLVGRRASVSRSRVIGSVMIERLADVVMLLGLAAVFSLTASLPAVFKSALLVLAFVTAVAIAVLSLGAEHWQYLVHPFLKLLPAQMVPSITMNLTQAAEGLQALRRPRQLFSVLVQTAISWGLSALAMTAFVWACGLQLPWHAGLFILVLTNLGGVIPVSPGSIGVYHFLAVSAVTIWAPDASAALSFAVITHVVSLLIILGAGTVSLARQGLSLGTLQGQLAVGAGVFVKS